MIDLSASQFHLIENVLSFASAAMGIIGAFLLLQRAEVQPKYRSAITVLGIVALLSAYNHFRLYQSWHGAFAVVNGILQGTGAAYDDSSRYSCWLLSIPLLLVAFVLALDMSKRQALLRGIILASISAEMVVLGLPGQPVSDAATRWLWWAIEMVPFTLILFQLFGSMAGAVKAQADEPRKIAGITRLLISFALSGYSVIYLLPLVGLSTALETVATQAGFAAADVLGFGLCGLLIYMLASSKTQPSKELVTATHAPALRGIRA